MEYFFDIEQVVNYVRQFPHGVTRTELNEQFGLNRSQLDTLPYKANGYLVRNGGRLFYTRLVAEESFERFLGEVEKRIDELKRFKENLLDVRDTYRKL